MKIGMDISIAECRRSGYMVMEFKKRELFTKGILNKDAYATFSLSFPEAWNDAGKPMVGTEYTLWSLEPSEYSWNDLMEMIEDPERRASVADCCDWENCNPIFDNPTEHDMLHLASDISAAIGL